jgi:Xaa-Pro aminopeptidase
MHTLANRWSNLVLAAGDNTVDLGTLLEGDADNDNDVDAADASLLNRAFGTVPGNANWDPRADLNEDDVVNATDMALLAASFGRSGDVEVGPGGSSSAARASRPAHGGADLLASWQQALPGVQWVDVEADVCNLRAQKSPAEIDVMRYAYHIAEAGFQAGVAAITPGATEREIAAEIDAAMRRCGSEGTGIDTIVASGPNSRPILARSTFRCVESNDLVLLTVAPRYEGYHAAIGRIVLVGDPGAEVTRALDVANQAQQACGAALRPGVEGREVEAAGRQIVKEAGFGQYFVYSGLHSVGVIEFEPPIFGPSSPATLKEGMVISVDIPMFNTPWGGLRVENGYLITADGAVLLHDTPLVIRK